MSKADDVLDALQGAFTCHCGRRYHQPPADHPAVCAACRIAWGIVVPGYESVRGDYVSRDTPSGWSSWHTQSGWLAQYRLVPVVGLEP